MRPIVPVFRLQHSSISERNDICTHRCRVLTDQSKVSAAGPPEAFQAVELARTREAVCQSPSTGEYTGPPEYSGTQKSRKNVEDN